MSITKQQLLIVLSNIDKLTNKSKSITRKLISKKDEYDYKHREYIIQNKECMFDKQKHNKYMKEINNYLRCLFSSYDYITELDDENIILDISLDNKGDLHCKKCFICLWGIFPEDQAKGNLGFLMEMESLLEKILDKPITMTLIEDEYDGRFYQSYAIVF
jgi:hypothetical protein